MRHSLRGQLPGARGSPSAGDRRRGGPAVATEAAAAAASGRPPRSAGSKRAQTSAIALGGAREAPNPGTIRRLAHSFAAPASESARNVPESCSAGGATAGVLWQRRMGAVRTRCTRLVPAPRGPTVALVSFIRPSHAPVSLRSDWGTNTLKPGHKSRLRRAIYAGGNSNTTDASAD
mmetsp:Transcript_69/g.209  ORF Transcript_69/g.209 Transcript_69/m.209 type:complete len:176 (-) Transcript_69:1129-1656(-)